MRRIFWAVVGIGIGAAVGVSAVRAVSRTKQRLAPANLARETSAKGGALMDRVRGAIEAGREAKIEKEAELRAELKLDR